MRVAAEYFDLNAVIVFYGSFFCFQSRSFFFEFVEGILDLFNAFLVIFPCQIVNL